jgi:hypothetical protein
MDDIDAGGFGCMLITVVFLGLGVMTLISIENSYGEAVCQKLGTEYHYVRGDRIPSVCATKEGKEVYFSVAK